MDFQLLGMVGKATFVARTRLPRKDSQNRSIGQSDGIGINTALNQKLLPSLVLLAKHHTLVVTFMGDVKS